MSLEAIAALEKEAVRAKDAVIAEKDANIAQYVVKIPTYQGKLTQSNAEVAGTTNGSPART